MTSAALGLDGQESTSGEARYTTLEVGDFAKLDLGRTARTGLPEVVWGPGKTPGQIAKIMLALRDRQSGTGALQPPVSPHGPRMERVPLNSAVRAVVDPEGEVADHPLYLRVVVPRAPRAEEQPDPLPFVSARQLQGLVAACLDDT